MTALRAVLIGVAFAALAGCALPAALPMALSVAGGAASLAKNVLDLDLSWRQLDAAPAVRAPAARSTATRPSAE